MRFFALNITVRCSRTRHDTNIWRYMHVTIYGNSLYTHTIYTVSKCADGRQCRHIRHATSAPLTPNVTLDHHQASPSPPGAASGAYNATNGDYLALARSHPNEVLRSGTHEAASRRHRWPPRAPHAPDTRGPCCHTQPGPRRPPLRASGDRWGRLGPCAGPMAACMAGPMGTRRRRCDDTATCPSAANGASESWATKASG